jgi:hypothetical protein
MEGRWLFNAQYAISSSVHAKHTHTHDSLSNSISVTPGYNYGKFSLNLSASYTHSLVRGPSYKKYSGNLYVGPMMRIALAGDMLLEFFSGYSKNDYYQPVLAPDEDRSSRGYGTYASWVWLFKKDSFLNLRYNLNTQNAKGRNWDNTSNSFSANVIFPMAEKVLLQLSGQITDQDYLNTHSTFGVKRDDKIYYLIGGLSWELNNNIALIAQYTRDRQDSNIGVYDYSRNLYTLGLEYKF